MDGMGRRVRWWAALAGVLAAGLAVAAAQLVAQALDPGSAPLTAVGSAFITVVPGWLKDLAVALFGVHDKAALFAGMGLVLLALSAGIGVAARRNPLVATAFVFLGFVGAAAAWLRPGAGQLAWLASIVGGGLGWAALRALLARLPAGAPRTVPDPAGTAEPGRRFLLAAGAVAGAGVVLGSGSWWLARREAAASAIAEAVKVPAPASVALPPGVDPPVSGLTPYRTANEDFYRIDTALAVPRIDPRSWRLRVHGLVEQEVELDFDELTSGPLRQAWVTLACVSNTIGGGLVGNASWVGLPIREVLGRARPRPGADMVLSTSADGFTASTPLDVLLDPDRDSLLAVTMNGAPLPREHGFPVRMVVPGLYGYVSATKWVTELKVTTFEADTAFWTPRGWSARGPVKTASRIDVPRAGARVSAGPTVIAGVAWAQHRGISQVEVRIDDGPWLPATLADTVGPDTWRQWTLPWTADPGRHLLQVRATDGTGQTQTSAIAPPNPDGATGWHEVRITVDS